MPTNIRLTKEEQKNLSKKCIEINKILVEKEMKPMHESELVHAVLELAVKQLKIDRNGKCYIDID